MAFFSMFGHNAKDKRLPDFIWQASKELIKEFLYGYAGDAYFKKKGQIRYTTVNKELAIDVNYLMRVNDICTYYVERFNEAHFSPQRILIKAGTCYDLEVPTYSNFVFPRVVHTFKHPSSKCLPTRNFQGESFYGEIDNKDLVSKDRVKRFVENNQVFVNKNLSQLINSNLGVIKIKSIIYKGEEPVGDYEVPGSECFFCGNQPILAHNSSEMFGSSPPPQNENTPFHPRSPYACAKVFSYHITRFYREAYGIFAANGILFNHECVSENTPVIIRDKDTKIISIKRVKDIRRAKTKGKNVQQWKIKNMDIWDGTKFVSLKLLTASRRKEKDDNFTCKIINTRNGIVNVTNHHNMIDDGGNKIKAKEIEIGVKLLHKKFPKSVNISSLSIDEAMFLGMMVGDGYIDENGRANFSNNNEKIREKFKKIWLKVGLGTTSTQKYKTEYGNTIRLILTGNHNYLRILRNEMYTFDGYKKVPDRILNANKHVQLAFLEGYNCTDGLQSNLCRYKFKNFKTNSNILLQGLLFLINQVTGQNFTLNFEEDEKYYGYYSANLLSPVDNQLKEIEVKRLLKQGKGQREINRLTGISRTFISKIQKGGKVEAEHHFSKDKTEVKKFLYHKDQPDWVYDIETDSGKFMAGVGTMIISNSPRRGPTFVTKKITAAIARIKAGLDKKIYLGNLNAKRDWGFAPEYMEVMYKILQQPKPDDFVIASGESHSVKEFLEEAFKYSGLGDWQKYVEIDPNLFRPAEVEILIGDYSKAKKELNWQPKIKFKDLVKIMVDADFRALGLTPPGEGDKILKEKFPNRWWKVD